MKNIKLVKCSKCTHRNVCRIRARHEHIVKDLNKTITSNAMQDMLINISCKHFKGKEVKDNEEKPI